ncbi:MAG: hypothetical protein ACI4XW_01250 [Candidatus Spyradocola sp.]
MKKLCILPLFCACALLAGCATPPMPALTPAPTVAPAQLPDAQQTQPLVTAVACDPACPPSALAAQPDFPAELYALLANAALAGQDSVDLPEPVTDEQLDAVRQALLRRSPLFGTLRDVTRGGGNTLRIAYTTDDPAERTEQSARLENAARCVLSRTVAPGQTQLSAALALYKTLAQTVQPDDAAADALAYAYGFLLDQAGIENAVVVADDGSHAWNVLTIGGTSFHCDAQAEAERSGGQALRCFGLSDADVARRYGRESWTAEDGLPRACPESLLPELLDAPSADVDAAGSAVYFTAMEGNPGVYRLDLTNGEVLQTAQFAADSVAVLGGTVYCLRTEDRALCRFDTDGGQLRTALEGTRIASLRRAGDKLLYTREDDPEHAIPLG